MTKKTLVYDEDENLEITKFNKYIKKIRHKIYEIHGELITNEKDNYLRDVKLSVFIKIYNELDKMERQIKDKEMK